MACQFVNDVGVKSLKTTYNNKKVAFKIRHYIIEYIQFFDKVFANIEKADAIIASAKSQFCMFRLKLISFICDANRKHLDTAKVIKILDWFEPIDQIEI